MSNLIKLKRDWEEEHPVKMKNGKTLYNLTSKPLYHYTQLSNFWNIIMSDHMYARHVRFSNDSEENKIGEEIINSILKGSKKVTPLEYYMLCFCEEPDLLSQWREYAKGGVSLKFDFSLLEYYTILNNTETTKKISEAAKSEDEKLKSMYSVPETSNRDYKEFQRVYAKPISVFYVKKGEILLFKDRYDWLTEEFRGDAEKSISKYMRMLIPYIKHEGFNEEKEARLLFEEKVGYRTFQVGYLEDEEYVKRPYIRVEFGNAEEKFCEECQIYFYNISNRKQKEIKEILKGNINITYHFFAKESLEDIDGEVVISSTKRQSEIFERVDYIVKRWNLKGANYKIWCQGHLPIREIMVGPCKNKEEVKESITQYIRGVYWLKYVDVKTSEIPYRG